MNTLVLDDYTINLIKTMALCKTEQMKAIKNKVMAKPFAPSSDKWLLFFDELHKNGLQKSDEYISNVMSIVIDTWVIWHVKTLDQDNSCEAIEYLHPAFELKRCVSSKFDRDWNARWNAAGKEIKWKGVSKKDGRMIALKTSPHMASIRARRRRIQRQLGLTISSFCYWVRHGLDADRERRVYFSRINYRRISRQASFRSRKRYC